MLYGFEEKQQQFLRIIKSGSLKHAYLFYGDSHIGKSLFAKCLASFVETGMFESANSYIDSLILSSDGNSIGIDAVRETKNFLSSTPLVSQKKTVIIDDAHFLTPEAQSALLKIVEDAPPHALLIFITHDALSLLPPLRSRLMKVYFQRVEIRRIADILIERFACTPSIAGRIALRSFGRIGNAFREIEKQSERKYNNTLEDSIEHSILDLREKGVEQNWVKIKWLCEREGAQKKFQLNEKLQEKAIKTYLSL